MSKRILSTFVVSVLMLSLLLLAACGTPATSPAATTKATATATPAATTDSTTAKKAAVTLEMMVDSAIISGNVGFSNALTKAQEISGDTINLSQYPSDQYENVLRTKLATGNAGDLFFCPYGLNVMPANLYAPLDGPWASKITSVTKPLTIRPSDSKIVKVPFTGEGNFGLIYNKDVLQKAGVKLPMKNFAEFTAACEAIKKTGVTPVFVPNKENWTAQVFLLSSMTGYYTNNLDITKKLASNEIKPSEVPGLVKLWENAGSLVSKGYVNKDYMSAMLADGEKAIANGTAAFMCITDGSYGNITKAYPDKIAGVGMTTTPLWDDEKDAIVCTNASGTFFSVPAKSKNVQAANDFINVMITEPVMKVYYSVVPGPAPYTDLGFDLPIGAWNKEMRDLASSIKPLSSWDNTPYEGQMLLNPLWGDFNLQVQSLFAGQSAKDSVTAWYKKYAADAKAKKLTGF